MYALITGDQECFSPLDTPAYCLGPPLFFVHCDCGRCCFGDMVFCECEGKKIFIKISV